MHLFAKVILLARTGSATAHQAGPAPRQNPASREADSTFIIVNIPGSMPLRPKDVARAATLLVVVKRGPATPVSYR